MRIWIDFSNSPHIYFFMPIIKRFRQKGHKVFITIRDFAQTVSLAKKYGIEGVIIGKHGGANICLKIINLMKRTEQLMRFANGKSIDIAVSHNSYTHTIAGRMIGAKVVTIMDYEGQPANHLAFRAAHKVIVPAVFPDRALSHFGACSNKTYKYEGFKEQIYLSRFKPNNSFIKDLVNDLNIKLSVDISKMILVTVRTPPTMATYHHFQNTIFEKLLEFLDKADEIIGIILPRNEEQSKHVKKKYTNLHVPSQPLDGRNLAHYSDLVISAGGTMNREAAILGTPAYSIFLGSMPAVDLKLIKMGRMIHITNQDELSKIRYKKKRKNIILKNQKLTDEITREILL